MNLQSSDEIQAILAQLQQLIQPIPSTQPSQPKNEEVKVETIIYPKDDLITPI